MTERERGDYWFGEYQKMQEVIGHLEEEKARLIEEHRAEIKAMEKEMCEAVREAAYDARCQEREDASYGY